MLIIYCVGKSELRCERPGPSIIYQFPLFGEIVLEDAEYILFLFVWYFKEIFKCVV